MASGKGFGLGGTKIFKGEFWCTKRKKTLFLALFYLTLEIHANENTLHPLHTNELNKLE